MKQFFVITLAAVLLTACGQQNSDENKDAAGSAVTVTKMLASAQDNIDGEVTIEGLVTHVCKHGGRRVHVTDAETNEKIRVEAPEDMPAFARELEGSDIVVKGILRETRIDSAYIAEYEQELLAAQSEEETHDHAGQDLAEHEKGMNKAEKEMKNGEGQGNDGHVEPQGMDAVRNLRAELAESGKPYISRWHLDCVTYSMKDGSDVPVAKDMPAEEGEEHAH
ncbi:hypothetical protein KQI65_17045 [bacterium]|nr:hypothetical protein [bacterium]